MIKIAFGIKVIPLQFSSAVKKKKLVVPSTGSRPVQVLSPGGAVNSLQRIAKEGVYLEQVKLCEE